MLVASSNHHRYYDHDAQRDGSTFFFQSKIFLLFDLAPSFVRLVCVCFSIAKSHCYARCAQCEMVRRVLLSRVWEPRSALCLSGAALIDRARLQSILDWSPLLSRNSKLSQSPGAPKWPCDYPVQCAVPGNFSNLWEIGFAQLKQVRTCI